MSVFPHRISQLDTDEDPDVISKFEADDEVKQLKFNPPSLDFKKW